MPMGAPGWPELDWKVVSTWETCQHEYWWCWRSCSASRGASTADEAPPLKHSQQTYRKSADGVDREGVGLVVAHLCGIVRWIW
jgi:hypothetical protein